MTGFKQGTNKPIAIIPDGARVSVVESMQSAVEFREVMRLIRADKGVVDLSGALAFTSDSEQVMRRVLVRYGFDRLPRTYDELFGLFEYCDCLDAASGIGMRPREQLAEWQAASFPVWRGKRPQLMPAIERFCAGDVEGLRELHRQEDTLTGLGIHYLGVEGD